LNRRSLLLCALASAPIALAAFAPAPPPAPPLVEAGEFVNIYDPSAGEKQKWYVNDHCFVRGADGTWHLIGITHAEPSDALDEDNFAHATSPDLLARPWKKLPFALTVAPEAPWREEHLWAPYVVEDGGTYYMYYCAGDRDHERYKIHLATSRGPLDVDAPPRESDGRRRVRRARSVRHPRRRPLGHVLHGATAPSGGRHVVKYVTSADLVHWAAGGTAFVDPSEGKYGGPTESPFVVRRGPRWYIFMGPRDGEQDVFDGTDVFVSDDPFHWRVEDRVGHLPAHAAEVVRDGDGRWYVSRCGAERGGVYLAPLTWKDGQTDPETNIPPARNRAGK
jgi:beta-fructofuranosidase